ncbi:MAG: hypothetical protein ACE5FT_02730 [Candidatus Nanoarchaeia archaeon]
MEELAETHVTFEDLEYEDLTSLEDTSLELCTLAFIDEHIDRIVLPPRYFREKFARVTPQEVLDRGFIPFMGPCVEVTPVMHGLIQEHPQVVDTWFLMDRLDFGSKSPRYRLHFATGYVVEVDGVKQSRTLDLNNLNNAYLRFGPYKLVGEKEHFERVGEVITFPGDQIKMYQPLHKSLGLRSMKDIGKLFPGYDFDAQKAKLAYCAKRGMANKIYLESYVGARGHEDLKLNVEGIDFGPEDGK